MDPETDEELGTVYQPVVALLDQTTYYRLMAEAAIRTKDLNGDVLADLTSRLRSHDCDCLAIVAGDLLREGLDHA